MRKRWLFAIITAFILFRVYLATLSSYGFYHGWNEGHYSLIARNYFSGSLWEPMENPGGTIFSSAPPFFSYVVFLSFKIFGISDISARLVSILSGMIAVLGVYILAREIYNEKTAQIAALIFLFFPWNVLWFARAQTDPLMTALMILAIALYVRAYNNKKSMLPFGITLGLAVFTKQPALAVLPIVLIWSYFQGVKKEQMFQAIACFGIGMMPFFIWLSYFAFSGNFDVIFNIIFGELAHRTEPFSDIGRVVLFTAAGISPLIIVAAVYQILKERNIKNILTIWLLIYGFFVLARTPLSHEYYSLPLMAPLAIFVSAGIARCTKKAKLFLIILLISTVPFTYAILTYSGDLGYTDTKSMGQYLREHYKEDVFLAVHMIYTPQMQWYSNARIFSIGDQSLGEIENMSGKQSLPAFLLIDENDPRLQNAGEKYEEVHRVTYSTMIPSPQIIPRTLILYRIN